MGTSDVADSRGFGDFTADEYRGAIFTAAKAGDWGMRSAPCSGRWRSSTLGSAISSSGVHSARETDARKLGFLSHRHPDPYATTHFRPR
jgi:hypothetical protein